MAWWDYFKIFKYAYEKGPLDQDYGTGGAGSPRPEMIPDLRAGGAGSSAIPIRDTNEFVDLSTVTNRKHRYKEYARLRHMAEIETAMTVFADESCVAGDTLVATPTYGYKTIKWLTENLKDEKFLVYCWDFNKGDFTLGWAFNPRKTKTAETVKIIFDDGTFLIATHDHRVLNSKHEWKAAGEFTDGDEILAFHKVDARGSLNGLKQGQFPRVYTHHKGWVHERQFVEEWKLGKDIEKYERANLVSRMVVEGLLVKQIEVQAGMAKKTIQSTLESYGFTKQELQWLAKRKNNTRKVVGVIPHEVIDVYDLSVVDHENFCTDWGVVHNCQTNEDGRVFEITVKDDNIKKELDFLCFHRTMLNMNQRHMWNKAKNLYINGDYFEEVIIDIKDPKKGIRAVSPLPAESMYRIETNKGRLVEFQQSGEGPDYESLRRIDVTQATEADLEQATAIRFAPEQVIHTKIGDDRDTFYPYGVSLIEPARGPAHQLRMMEDAMVVYRLCLTGDARVRSKNGWKYIKDIEKNEIVYSLNSNGEVVETFVENQVCNGVKDVFKVRSKHVEIKGTATHPVLVNRKGIIQYVDIQDLQVGEDQILNVAHESNEDKKIPRIFGEPWAKLTSDMREAFLAKEYKNKSDLLRQCKDFGRAKQFLYAEGKALPLDWAQEICDIFGLDSNDLLVVNKGENNSERINLPEYVDEDFARLFGFLHGDGHVRDHQISFSTGENQSVNERYRSLLEQYFSNVSFELDKRSEKGHGKYVVHSTTASQIMCALGYEGSHSICRVPGWVFDASSNIRKAFVEGFSDADGCERYTKAGTWFSTIELSNKGLVEDIKELWSSIGLASGHISYRTRNGGHEIVEGRTMPPTTSYILTISSCELPQSENVLSIDHIGTEKVYDITVNNEEHNFIVNGTCVHNTRAPERRLFYIDVQGMSSSRAEAFIERMKDQFKKKKVTSNRGTSSFGSGNASAVEERWHAPAADEDYWIPIRPNNNTRIETLPGAQNLGEIDDTVYFRNKLFVALNFPKNYLNNEDPQVSRMSASALDTKFARLIERLQSHIEDSIWQLCDRHLKLRGYPEETYEDLQIKMTPPSDWRELQRMEVVSGRIQNAGSLKGAQMLSDFDILTLWLKYPEEDAKKMLARLKIQKLEELKLQIIAQNPALLGVGVPGPDEEQINTEPNEENPIIGGEGEQDQQPPPMDDEEGEDPGSAPMGGGGQPSGGPETGGGQLGQTNIPEPSEEDIKKYNLDIKDYGQEMDQEEVDFSEM